MTEDKKPTLALLCGYLLFRGYVEVFHGLANTFDITVFVWPDTDLPTTDINLRTEKVWPVDIVFPKNKLGRVLRRQVGNRIGYGYVPGFEKRLANFDILYTQEAYSQWTLQSIKTKRLYNNKVVVQVIENLPFRREREPRCLQAKRAAYSEGDMFLAQTLQAKDVCVMEGADEDKVRIAPLAVNTELFKPSPKDDQFLRSIQCSSDDQIVLYVGRLLCVKGIFDFVESARHFLRQQVKPTKFVVVGDGPDKDMMLKYIDAYAIGDSFRFLPRQDYKFMPTVFNSADVVVVPSSISDVWQEQFGMVLAESMACGKPIVTTLTGAIPEVVGDNAILVPCNSPVEIAQRITELLSSPDRRIALGTQAREWVVGRYSIDVVANAMGQALLSVL